MAAAIAAAPIPPGAAFTRYPRASEANAGVQGRRKTNRTLRGCRQSRQGGGLSGEKFRGLTFGRATRVQRSGSLSTRSGVGSGCRPCENVGEPRTRRTVFSITFIGQPSPALLGFRLTKLRRTFYERIERANFRTAWVDLRRSLFSRQFRLAWA